jgi:hypothetical protein
VTDNGASYIATDLAKWLDGQGMEHVRAHRITRRPKGRSSAGEREIKAFILLIGFGEPISLRQCRCRKVSVARFPADGRKPMTVRTTRTTISFSQPFKLRDVDDIQPAGDYLLDTDEELIEGLSRLAYRRVATLPHLPSTSRPQSRTELLSVNPAELDAALEKDRVG